MKTPLKASHVRCTVRSLIFDIILWGKKAPPLTREGFVLNYGAGGLCPVLCGVVWDREGFGLRVTGKLVEKGVRQARTC